MISINSKHIDGRQLFKKQQGLQKYALIEEKHNRTIINNHQ